MDEEQLAQRPLRKREREQKHVLQEVSDRLCLRPLLLRRVVL
jgi:hypothetical protein